MNHLPHSGQGPERTNGQTLATPSPLRRRWIFQQTATDQVLMLSSIFSCLMVAVRILHTGRPTFLFMPWNLLLAYVPYYLSSKVVRQGGGMNRVVRVAALLVWLLFIPNSYYILTDLYHLADGHRDSRVPEWYDLVLILCFAWNGLLLGVLSTRQVEKILIPEATWKGRWVFLYPVMWLNALGVYIGRYLRFNSWDIIASPVDLFGDILRMIVHPLRYHGAWGMIVCYSFLLTIIYSLLTKTDGQDPAQNHEPWKI